MKPGNLFAAVALSVALCGCGGGGGGGGMSMMPAPPASPPPPQSYMASVQDVFALTQTKSETDDPISVDGGNGGSVAGSDETSDPMAVE